MIFNKWIILQYQTKWGQSEFFIQNSYYWSLLELQGNGQNLEKLWNLPISVPGLENWFVEILSDSLDVYILSKIILASSYFWTHFLFSYLFKKILAVWTLQHKIFVPKKLSYIGQLHQKNHWTKPAEKYLLPWGGQGGELLGQGLGWHVTQQVFGRVCRDSWHHSSLLRIHFPWEGPQPSLWYWQSPGGGR